MSKTEFNGFVLVGGESRRMRSDKALLAFDGVPLAHRLAERVRSAAGSAVLVGSPSKYGQLGWPLIEDLFPGRGPLAGIHAALKHSGARWSLVVGCDLPFLTVDFLRFLLEKAAESGAQLVVPVSGGGYELAAVFRHDCLPAVEAAIQGGDYKLSHLYERLHRRDIARSEWQSFDSYGNLFENVNAPEEMERARRRIKSYKL